MGKISTTLRKTFSKKRKIIPLDEIREVVSQSEQLLDTVSLPDRLKEYDPLHAIHIITQNLISVFAEQLSLLPELDPYYNKAVEAEDHFMPNFPPISPVTRSYFTMWAFYDLCFGKDKESIASLLLDLSEILDVPSDWVTMVELQRQSRMGVYEHGGFHEEKILLKDLISNQEFPCICPAGYKGTEGELWFARIVGSPLPSLDYKVVFITPYLLRGHDKTEWLAFFERQGITGNAPEKEQKLEAFMKHPPTDIYWHQFIVKAYDGYQKDGIFLRGIPDLPMTLPHGEMLDC